jgi:DNA-directed RNA polymerase specialized sigma24 family protein
MSDRHLIKKHKIREINSDIDYNEWCRLHPTAFQKGILGDRFETVKEDIRANPDNLRSDETFYTHTELTEPQEIMGRAISQLQGRPKEAYLLTMREGKSLSEAAAILKVSKAAIQIYRQRAIKFIAAYCKLAMKNRGL